MRGKAAHTPSMKRSKYMPYLAGLITGICNGLLGAGGGMIAVAALEGLCGLSEQEAHATALAIMLPLTGVSSVIYAMQGAIPWQVLAFVAPGLAAGSMLGARLTGKLSDKALCRIFGTLMLVAGGWMLL